MKREDDLSFCVKKKKKKLQAGLMMKALTGMSTQCPSGAVPSIYRAPVVMLHLHGLGNKEIEQTVSALKI